MQQNHIFSDWLSFQDRAFFKKMDPPGSSVRKYSLTLAVPFDVMLEHLLSIYVDTFSQFLILVCFSSCFWRLFTLKKDLYKSLSEKSIFRRVGENNCRVR